MKKIISFVAVCLVAVPALAVAPTTQGRRSLSAQMLNGSPRQVASVNQLNSVAAHLAGATTTKPSVRVEPEFPPADAKPDVPDTPDTPDVDMREKEKAACINNNIGVGNTFVWASRYSNTSDYASMTEDLENPENNTCFVRVDVRSDDARVNVSDVPSKYFEWGTDITCGSWMDENLIRQRILNAKRSGRTWGTVAGAVGGAGLGVGIMELFGNRLIGGAVEGQKGLQRAGKDTELLRSQLLQMKKENRGQYDEFIKLARELRRECVESGQWNNVDDSKKPEGCTKFDFDTLLSVDAEL